MALTVCGASHSEDCGGTDECPEDVCVGGFRGHEAHDLCSEAEGPGLPCPGDVEAHGGLKSSLKVGVSGCFQR